MTDLGDYLRSRRALVTPADVGLPAAGHRRVPGLRREEVALLAGLSVDYYSRLEQGRERSPSAQVLDALAAVLRLDEDGRRHLFAVAGLTPRARLAPVPDRVDPALMRLMATWPDNPALVYNRAYDLLASNALADALYDGILHHNMLMMVFTEPRARELYADWPVIAADAVAGFRMNHGIAPHDPRINAVLTELLDRSAEFTELWSRHDARGKSATVKSFRHPQVGAVTLQMQTFDVRSAPGQELVVYQAEPGTPSADALKLLGSLAATAEA
ncbi:helix-turn-helix domain-containing protein [Mycolicibacterium smegmatis]|nr:helix-turn-helix transcriptional regulator [Mycolicibacterium smegmatis]ABK71523.1 DNA-binding protein [Mycolicibacterium smegmatis MC2 155]AIU05539.1 XRE family transcriptional regulator [Mycolicibacterium smegmatis MC2 155]AIU12164.1 XRE family transcriptional regulator [Mycolicibacterium smegmatis]AIU18788.1 XRE family transcriptional regulator [Mycolicibacterium smegmatis]MBE9618803.1 helix-turn-helix domain-containing protein [Mycolicibacterium smegmatis]